MVKAKAKAAKKTGKLDIAKESQAIKADYKAGKITERELDVRFQKLEEKING